MEPLKAKPLVAPVSEIVATPLAAAEPRLVPRKRIEAPEGAVVVLFCPLVGTLAEPVKTRLV